MYIRSLVSRQKYTKIPDFLGTLDGQGCIGVFSNLSTFSTPAPPTWVSLCIMGKQLHNCSVSKVYANKRMSYLLTNQKGAGAYRIE